MVLPWTIGIYRGQNHAIYCIIFMIGCECDEEDYTNNFNNKKALKERFDFEIRRQWSKNSYYE